MSIEQRGSRWRARVRRAGQARYATFATREEAVAWESATIAALLLGEEPPAAPEAIVALPVVPVSPLSLIEACREWTCGALAGSVRTREGRRYRPKTIATHEYRLRLHCLPYIGAIPVTALTRGTVRRWLEDLAADKGASIAGQALDSLRPVLRRLVDLEVLVVNPCAGVRAPVDDEERPRRFLDPQEGERLLGAARADRHPLAGPFVDLGLATGARRGELLALEWGPGGLDLERRTACIVASLDMATMRVGPTKSGKPREVPIGRNVAARMREMRMAQGRPPDGTRVFPFDPREPFNRARAAAGLAEPLPTIHSLRHTAATWWLAAGKTTHEVADLLGHADARLIERLYGHALPSRVATAGDDLERFLAGEGWG